MTPVRAKRIGLWIIALLSVVACSDEPAVPGSRSTPTPDRRPEPKVVFPDESQFEASTSDGGGRVSCSSREVGVREPVTLEFEYEAGPLGIAIGGGVFCRVSQFWGWTPPQVLVPQRPGYVTTTCSNPAVRLDTEAGFGHGLLAVRIEDSPLIAGDRIVIRYGDTTGGRFPMARGASDRFAEREERFYFKVDGDGDSFATSVAEQPTFDVVATRPRQVALIGPSRVMAGEAFELSVAVLDAIRNRVRGYRGELIVSSPEHPEWPEQRIELGDDAAGARRFSLTLEKPGAWIFAVRDSEGLLEAEVSNPILVTPAGDERYHLYWGDLQIHGNLSDGTGTPDDLYGYARDVARLDVAAVTDHDQWGYEPLKGPSGGWRKAVSATEQFHEPGRFVTFPAYEYTNWTTGHRHVIFAETAEADVFSWSEDGSRTPEQLWKLLDGRRAITIPHHPGGGPIPIYWPVHEPAFEPVVEIASIHGVSERMDHPAVIHQPVASGMVVEALKRGYRLGFLGSGDTHDGHPGLGNPTQPPPGLAGIWAEELTRDSIFEAIRARRVYATFGSRSLVRFHAGEVPMGSVHPRQDEAVEFEGIVLADAPIRSIAFVENGEVAHRIAGEGLFASVSWSDDEPRSGDSCYLRVELEGGGWLWSSPIWIE